MSKSDREYQTDVYKDKDCWIGGTRRVFTPHAHPVCKETGYDFPALMYCPQCHQWYKDTSTTLATVFHWEPIPEWKARLLHRKTYQAIINNRPITE